ncbi:MAG: hypothetical protein ACFFHD_07095, partial [Promethearchaeota archaeon]
LCLAIINGDTPLNLENAWMRFPIFIQMANIYFENKNYYYAALAIKKAALIAEIYKKEEFYIISEQAAFLYSKINLYLEASKILEDLDKRKSNNYKKLYAEAIITDGNRLFNKSKYKKAARMYEQAAQWSSIELLDRSLIDEAFKLSVNSWISACKVEDAFRILESLPHKEIISILKEIVDKIVAEADFLLNTRNYQLTKDQLYLAINRYQQEDLFEELKKLTFSMTRILIEIFKNQVKEKELYAAKNTYDEIENMWASYNVEKSNLDSNLKTLINYLLEQNDFSMATVFINKLNSLKLKQDLTKLSSKFEEEYKKQLKKETERIIEKGINILREYANSERNIIVEMNTEKIQEANELIKQNNYIKAANHLKHQADYLKTIGKNDIRDQILTRSLDILVENKNFEEFFTFFEELSISMKKNYLIRIFPIYLESLKEIKESENFERNEKIFKNSSKIFRNLMLYDESREINRTFIKVIKQEALNILETEKNISGINKATDLVKQVLDISRSYLEKEEKIIVTFNRIYKKIAEIYIQLDDLASAHSYNDKIEKREYKTEIHNKIAELEEKKSTIRLKKVEESLKGAQLKEKHSIIKNLGREAQFDKVNEFKERKAFRKAYFEEAIQQIKNNDYENAVESYKELFKQFNRIERYKLASLCLAITSLLLIKQGKIKDIKIYLNEIKKEVSSLRKLFVETYPITLIEYIINVKEYQDESKFIEALSYFEYLPLFEEELEVLYKIIGKEYKGKLESEKTIKAIAEIENTNSEIKKDADSILKEKEELSRKEIAELSKLQIEMDQIFGKIQSKMVDIRREKEEFLKKRKAMKKRYYKSILDLLNSQKYKDAGLEYLELAETLSKRKDLNSSSLLLLLHGLSLFKAGESLKIIKSNIDNFLNTLGINKEFFKDTFYNMLILFLIEVKANRMEIFFSKIHEILEILPLFEEEKELIEIED